MSPRTAVIVSTQPSMHLGTDVNVVYGYGGGGLAPNPSVTIPASLRDLRSPLAAVSCKIGAERFTLYLCCAGQQLPSARVICKLTVLAAGSRTSGPGRLASAVCHHPRESSILVLVAASGDAVTTDARLRRRQWHGADRPAPRSRRDVRRPTYVTVTNCRAWPGPWKSLRCNVMRPHFSPAGSPQRRSDVCDDV